MTVQNGQKEFADFACDYSIRARAISSLSLLIIFSLLDFIYKLSLPLGVFAVLALFETFINQPYRFLREKLKSRDTLLLITNLIDIVVISIAVYFVGGISFIFTGFFYLIVIVFNGIFGGSMRAILLAGLSSASVFVLDTLERLGFGYKTILSLEINEQYRTVLTVSYILVFFLFSTLVHIPSRRLWEENKKRREIEKELNRQIFSLEILYGISNTAIRAETIDEVYHRSLDGITKALGISKASILLIDPDGVMRFKAWRGLSETYRKAVEGHSPWKPDDPNPQIILVGDVEKEPTLGDDLKQTILSEGINALAFVPLVYAGKLLGKFMVYYDEPHRFTVEEIGLMHSIAIQISFAIGKTLSSIELKRWRDKYEKVVMATKEVVYEWDILTDSVIWEGDIEAIFGYSKDEFQAKRWSEIIHPDDLREVMKKIEEAIHSNVSTLEVEYRILTKEGKVRYCLDYASIMRDETGKAIKSFGMILDITLLKETQIRLMKEESMLRAINFSGSVFLGSVDWEKEIDKVLAEFGNAMQVSLAYIFKNEVKNGVLFARMISVWASEGFERIEKSKGQVFSFKDYGFERWGERLSKGEMIYGKLSDFPVVEVISLKELGIKSIIVVPIFVGGKWWGVIGVADCISEKIWTDEEINIVRTFADILGMAIHRTENEKALVLSEQKYRKLFEDSKDPIYISTPEGKLLDVNPAFVKLFGYSSKEEILKVDIARDLYVNPEDRRKNLEAIEKQGFIKDYELTLKTKDGKVLTVYDTSTPIYDENGNIIAYQGILRDVTVLKRLEQQLFHSQKMDALGRLSMGIAHDINNILTVVLGNVQLARRNLYINLEEVKRRLDEIEQAGKKGGDFLKKILVFSREQPMEMRVLDLNSVINDFAKVILKALRENVKLDLILAPRIPNVKADVAMINQVLLNLIVNAQEAITNDGKIIVETYYRYIDEEYCKLNLEARPGDYVVLAITDTGVGIPREIMDKIFEPFFTTKKGGSGLGLSVVYGIVKQHGGFINVYSEVGQGTTFRIYLPAVYEEAETIEAEERKVEVRGGTETILVVEDEAKLRETVCDILKGLGYKVYSASNGLEGIEVFKERKDEVDLVLLDIVMPVLGGYEAMREIVKIKPGVKIIFATGYSLNGLNLQLEGFDIIQKPYSYESIAIKVREVLDRGREQNANV